MAEPSAANAAATTTLTARRHAGNGTPRDTLADDMLDYPGTPGCPVLVLTVATRLTLGAHNMLASLRHYGYAYRVLGFGTRWTGWRYRMELYEAALRAAPPESLVACVDAYDVVATRPWDGIDAAWTRVAGGAPLVTGMEKLAYPRFLVPNAIPLDAWWAAAAGRRVAPPPAKPYLNAGWVMGRAHALADAYRWVLDAGFTDDQIGLASWVTAHATTAATPTPVWSPDLDAVLVSNKTVAQDMTLDEERGASAYFLHFPGPKDYVFSLTPGARAMQRAWRLHSGVLGVHRAACDTDPLAWGIACVATFVACALLLLVVVPWWRRRGRT